MLIDVTRLLDRAMRARSPTGIDRVGLAYVSYFRGRALALVRFSGRWLVLSYADSTRLFDSLLSHDASIRQLIVWLIGKSTVLNWQRPSGGDILINTGHCGIESEDYGRQVRRYGLQPIYFLHDLIPLTFPEYCRPGELERHHRRLRTILETGRGVVVNSVTTGKEFASYADSLGLAVPQMIAAHLAPPSFLVTGNGCPLREPYFVIVATIEPRKNHLLLLNLWRRLVNIYGGDSPRLVVIGQRGWECEQVVDMLERCEVLRGYVIEISGCDDKVLGNWVANALALLFPSFAEGYGIPLVEALSLGTPVIASDLPVFRELAGDVPDYLDPIDGEGWYQAVLNYAENNSPRRAAQKARLAGWLAPTWERHFEKIEDFLTQSLGVQWK